MRGVLLSLTLLLLLVPAADALARLPAVPAACEQTGEPIDRGMAAVPGAPIAERHGASDRDAKLAATPPPRFLLSGEGGQASLATLLSPRPQPVTRLFVSHCAWLC